MNSHQIVDLFVLGVLIYFAKKGASRGLLSQLAWVAALLLCFKFSGTVAPAIEPMIGVAPPLKHWIAMLVVYVGLCGASFVAASMLSRWMRRAKIIDFDRHLGSIVGFVKGIVICMTAMFFAITMSEHMRQIASKTYSGYAAAVILNNSQCLIALLPEQADPIVRKVIDEFNRHLKPAGDDLNGAKPSSMDAFGADSVAETANSSEDSFNLYDLMSGSSSGQKGADSGRESEDESVADLFSRLPPQIRKELDPAGIGRLRSTTREEKHWLLDHLRGSIPEDAGTILRRFLSNTNTNPGKGLGTSASSLDLDIVETALLHEISGIYGRPGDIVAKGKRFLAGLPENVQRKVLEDWHSDAMGLNQDPDPGTDINKPLDVRILRQLRRAGVSLDQLNDSLRQRLRDASLGQSDY